MRIVRGRVLFGKCTEAAIWFAAGRHGDAKGAVPGEQHLFSGWQPELHGIQAGSLSYISVQAGS